MSQSRLLGYARSASSSMLQINDQVNRLMKYGVKPEDIYADKGSGTAMERPALEALQRTLQSGDTVIVVNLSRLARSPVDLMELLEGWASREIRVVIVEKQPDLSVALPKGWVR